MSNRPTKRAKKAPALIQRGAHVETSTTRGIRVRNVGIGPAPSVSMSRMDDNPGLQSFPDISLSDDTEQLDFTLPTYEEVQGTSTKVAEAIYYQECQLICFPDEKRFHA